MKSSFFKAVLSFLVLLSSNAYASHSVPCSSCNMSTQARLVADTRSPGETFTIIDTTNLVAGSFRTELINVGGEPFVVARSIPLTSTGRSDLENLRNSFALVSTTIVEIPEDLPNTNLPESISSSSDLILTPTIRGPIGSFIRDGSNVADRISGVVGLVFQTFGLLPDDLPLDITIRFPDGSTATYQITGTENGLNLVWEYLEGSAKDAQGNRVPDSEGDFLGDFQFETNEALENAINLAELFGIGIIEAQTCRPTKTISCSTTGGARICTIFQLCL